MGIKGWAALLRVLTSIEKKPNQNGPLQGHDILICIHKIEGKLARLTMPAAGFMVAIFFHLDSCKVKSATADITRLGSASRAGPERVY